MDTLEKVLYFSITQDDDEGGNLLPTLSNEE